jgi:tetratricopeptide (TPR) repeat protein
MQALREAEGYLELANGLTEQWPVSAAPRDRLVQRALDTLAPLPATGGHYAHILYLTGLAYRTMHRFAEAVPHLKAAAELDPENIAVWLALGWCYKRTDHLPDAIHSLESALEADRQKAIVHYNLACYWSLAGNADRAIQYLAQSFEIDPNYRELVATETDFDPIRNLPGFQDLLGVIV